MTPLNELITDENNIAFHPMMGNSYQLNTIGKEILQMLQQSHSKEQIVDHLHHTYGVEKSTLFIDVSDFISKLKIYGLYQ